VVFLHGLFGQGRNWTTIAKGLADEHRVMLVDLPHHGRSSWPERWDFFEAADEIAQLWPDDEPVTLVGHSLGGKTAMVLALCHAAKVERLVVADISPVAYSTGSEFAGYMQAMRALDLSQVEHRSDADRLLEPAVPNTTVRSFLLQNLRRDSGEEGWRWQVNLDVLERDLPVLGAWPEEQLADLAPYDGKVLWLAGERSDYVKPEYDAAMDRWFPRNRRVTIKGAGHWLHSERPDVFLEALRRFVAD
jgi:esterase